MKSVLNERFLLSKCAGYGFMVVMSQWNFFARIIMVMNWKAVDFGRGALLHEKLRGFGFSLELI